MKAIEMSNATTSYRCPVSSENRMATLTLGGRKLKVEVTELSRDSFSVLVPNATGKKLVVGKSYRLFYQDMLWGVVCRTKWVAGEGKTSIEFDVADELTPLKLVKGPWWSKTKGANVYGQSDTTLPFALITAFVLAVLIMPAWGGKWGTSDALCGAVNLTWKTIIDLCTGR